MNKNESAYLSMIVNSFGSNNTEEIFVDSEPTLSLGYAYYIKKYINSNYYSLIEESTDSVNIPNVTHSIHINNDYCDVIVIYNKKEICSYLKKNLN